jgi:hypothetical protein
MSSNSVQIIHQIHRDFQELVEYVTSEESQTRTAYEVELTLFRRLSLAGPTTIALVLCPAGLCPPQGACLCAGRNALEIPRHAPDDVLLRLWQSAFPTALLPRVEDRKVSALWTLN